MGSLYIEAQACVPVLLENLHAMSCSGVVVGSVGNTQQVKEQDKCPPNQTEEEEIGNQLDKRIPNNDSENYLKS